jgi:hypothetical protein
MKYDKEELKKRRPMNIIAIFITVILIYLFFLIGK